MYYFRFVWGTSKVIDGTNPILDDALKNAPHKFVAVLWHQDVMFVAFAFRRFHGITMASVGDSGEVISKMLHLCNFTVFRGGSSKKERRRKQILPEFIEYLKSVNRAGVGITVDGSSGPAYRMKAGAIVMAMEAGMQVFTVRVWCKRKFFLPSWDRTTFPLPFNKILILAEGPYPLPPDMHKSEVFQEYHKYLETQLLNLAYKGFLQVDRRTDPELMRMFPEDWTPPK
jgi:lysophospholipid acyltransferase (LPLAT)-like uncharacterized protein